MPLAFFGIMGTGYLLYLDAGRQIIGYLPYTFTPYEFYNLSLRPILMWLVGRITENPFSLCERAVRRHPGARHGALHSSVPQDGSTSSQWGVGLIALYLILSRRACFNGIWSGSWRCDADTKLAHTRLAILELVGQSSLSGDAAHSLQTRHTDCGSWSTRRSFR